MSPPVASGKQYNPTDEQLANQRKDRVDLDRDLRYRQQFEVTWLKNAQKWNLVAPPGLEGVPNYVIPISRLATNTGIVSMRQRLPDIVPVPEGADEKKLSYILKEASAHVHRMCNMEGVMDQAMVDYAVLGNMILESYVQIPYRAKRVPIMDVQGNDTGKYETIYKRDWSKSKLGSRARSIWECTFDSGARTPDKIRRCSFQDRMIKPEFDELYLNSPDNEYYINLDLVEPGVVWTFTESGTLERTEATHDKIVIDNFQNELTDSWRKYANGILIYDRPLSESHEHGKITLSLIPNHHKYDSNMKTHALYGAGDPELLAELDDLINATTNMFILNYRNKNTYVVGIEGALDVDEVDFTSGHPVKGKVTVQSLGAADLPEWKAFKDDLEEWAIQMVKKNYKRLEGEVAKTAYEASQKKDAENLGMEYQIKKMEAGGLLEYAKKHVSDMFEHLTVEEWQDAAQDDLATIQELMKSGQVAKDDVVLGSDGKTPLKVRYMERIRTRGRVYKEKLKSGKRSLGGLEEDPNLRGQDGWLPASKEYITTREWRLFKKIPDIYLIGSTMLGEDDVAQLAKIDQLLGHVQSIVTLSAMPNPAGPPIDGLKNLNIDKDKLMDWLFDAVDKRKDELSVSTGNPKLAKAKAGIKAAKDQLSSFLNPHVPLQTAVQGGTPQPGPGAAPGQAPQVSSQPLPGAA